MARETVSIIMDRPSLPVLYACDAVVIDGSFGGIAAALALARAGRRVAAVESRTYLGREVTATLRPWVSATPLSGGALPPLLADCLAASGAAAADGEHVLLMDAVKIGLEDALLEAGVKLLYASRPVALCTAGNRLTGVVIANKSGRQVITCSTVIDASSTALAARLAGAVFEKSGGTAACARTVEFDRVDGLNERELAVPASLGIAGDRVLLHRGHRGPGHILVEHCVQLPADADDAVSLAARETAARRITDALVDHLYGTHPAFDKAALGASSYELLGPHAKRMSAGVPAWAGPLPAVLLGDAGTCAAASFAGPMTGLWCLNDAARVSDAALAQLREPVCAARIGDALGRIIDKHWPASDTEPSPAVAESIPTAARLHVKEQAVPQTGRAFDMVDVAPVSVPVVRTADVLVVGGGSSGVMAAIAAAREGVRTTLVDMNPGLGGTGTYGGVDLLWFPRPIGCFGEFYERISRMHEKQHARKPQGIMPSYTIAARLRVQMEAAEEAGVELFLNSITIATIVEGDAVRGVIAATPTGPVAILAGVTVDATGDGDVAAFAGAENVMGTDREHAVMYALMPQEDKPGRFLNVKTSMLDVSDIEDYTRMILVERRRRNSEVHDHAIYLAPRESRHIIGGVRLSLSDQLLKRCWQDVVYVAFSNCDMKGPTGSDWHRMGLQCPNLEIEIPYRALVPKELKGILVAGKAFSATHDSIAAPRMQPDLENLGGVAGIAAAMAVRANTTPGAVDIHALQRDLVAKTYLPASVLTRNLVPLKPDAEALVALVAALDGTKPLHSYSAMEVGERYDGRVDIVDALCAGPDVIPVLEKALNTTTGQTQLLVAQALAAVGSAAGVPVLIAAIEQQLAAGEPPARTAKIYHAGEPPNQCGASDTAFLLYSLGMACDSRALPVWQRVVGLLESTTPGLIVDRWKAHYFYIDAVCCGAERLGDPAAIPLLSQMHGYAPLHDRVSLSGVQPDWFEERCAYLELLISRALARCGSAAGYRILAGYLRDNRAVLAVHALAELAAISGENFGRDHLAWNAWIDKHAAVLKPVPWTGALEPVTMWNEEVLTAQGETK